MKYKNIVYGKFADRPNRFIAHVWVDGKLETVHVKNTGRCKELLLPMVDVALEVCNQPTRKTKYDLIAVKKASVSWINIDSQAPNKVVKEWLFTQDYDYVRPEFTYGKSRIDFYMEKNTDEGIAKYLMEVKGCTLEIDGEGFFPDAPTKRGVKHLNELAEASRAGYHCILAFVIQMQGVHIVHPNIAIQKEFGEAMERAKKAGVEVWFLTCDVAPDTLEINV